MRIVEWNPVGPPALVRALTTKSSMLCPPFGPALKRATLEGMPA
jgi:hypothetical protein